jgi:transposase
LSKQQIEELKQALNKSPSESGYEQTHCLDGKTCLAVHSRRVRGVVCLQIIYRLLKKIGFKLAKPYVTHAKQDEKEVENFEIVYKVQFSSV